MWDTNIRNVMIQYSTRIQHTCYLKQKLEMVGYIIISMSLALELIQTLLYYLIIIRTKLNASFLSKTLNDTTGT